MARHIELFAALFAALTVVSSCLGVATDPVMPQFMVQDADWHSVPSSGGKINVNDLTLEFPAGAFTGEGKVAVTPVPQGSLATLQGCEVSECYQLVFPTSGVQKPFNVSFNYSGDTDEVGIVEVSPKMGRYSGVTDLHPSALWTTFDAGTASAEIGEIGDGSGSQPYLTVGLVKGVYQSSVPFTKAGGGQSFKYSITWIIPKDVVATWEPYKMPTVKALEKEIKNCVKVYAELGMDAPTFTVCYEMFQFDKVFTDPDEKGADNNWGQHHSDRYKKKNSIIEMNLNKFKPMMDKGEPYDTDLYGQFQQTVIHETFHLIHEAVYDPRWQSVICKQGHNEWSMLSEAIATWIEQFTGNKQISENTPSNAETFANAFFNEEGKGDFQNIGYGMGSFIDWLAKTTSNADIVKILKYQYDNGSWRACPTLRSAYDSFLKEKKKEFFNPSTNWETFMWDLLTGKRDSRVNAGALGRTIKIEHVMQSIDDPVLLDKDIDDIDVYNYSMSIHRIRFPNKGLIEQKMTTNPGLSMAFYQDNEALRSWVCDVNLGKLGCAVKDKPFAVSGDVAKRHIAVVTERIKQDTDPVVLKSQLTSHIVPWPKHIEIEYNGYDGFYSWNGSEIKVKATANGYYVEADCHGGAHLHFYIGWVNDRFTDVSDLYFYVEYDQSRLMKVGRVPLDYYTTSSVEKHLKWKCNHQGKDLYLSCDLL